jgi:hypothetical protein
MRAKRKEDTMIRVETLERMWSCYREINVGKKLLSEMEELVKNEAFYSRDAEKLKDAFGHQRDLQLGIPCGQNGHKLLGVSSKLATSIIRSHIANKEAELKEANEQARIELDMAADSSTNTAHECHASHTRT